MMDCTTDFVIVSPSNGDKQSISSSPLAEEVAGRVLGVQSTQELDFDEFAVVIFHTPDVVRLHRGSAIDDQLAAAIALAQEAERPGECRFGSIIQLANDRQSACAICIAMVPSVSHETIMAAITSLAEENLHSRRIRYQRIKELLERKPEADFDKEYDAAEQLMHLVRLEIASRIQTPFNNDIRRQADADYEITKQCTKWANDKLRRLGLAVKDPETGAPGILLAQPHPRRSIGRIIINSVTDEGDRRRAVIKPLEMTLELIEAAPRRVYPNQTARQSPSK